MRISLVTALALAACGQASDTSQAKPRAIEAEGFLRRAVLEGLQEDRADRAFVKECIADKAELFVLKCPVCEPIRRSFTEYGSAQAGEKPVEGKGIPKDITDELKHGARLARLNALERLVDRYTARHYERLKMTAEERARLQARLEELKKIGMKMKELGSPNFGDFCPSCNGAAKAR